MVSSQNRIMWPMARKHMWGEVYEPLVDDQRQHNPIFVENNHERSFSIISKANTFGFFTKKGSPPEIQECDLWHWNICGVRCTSLWSLMNVHSTPIFVENCHGWPFTIILKANTYEFFYQEMVSTRNPRMWPMARKHMWGYVYEPLIDDQWPHNPHFCRK
jgi:hypothetical protein